MITKFKIFENNSNNILITNLLIHFAISSILDDDLNYIINEIHNEINQTDFTNAETFFDFTTDDWYNMNSQERINTIINYLEYEKEDIDDYDFNEEKLLTLILIYKTIQQKYNKNKSLNDNMFNEKNRETILNFYNNVKHISDKKKSIKKFNI